MGFIVCTCTNYTQDRNLECEELIRQINNNGTCLHSQSSVTKISFD